MQVIERCVLVGCRVRVPVRRVVLRGAPVQRQARVLVRLQGARRAGDPTQQPRRRQPEDTQDMSPLRAPLPALPTYPTAIYSE